jgi:hypothetical protein
MSYQIKRTEDEIDTVLNDAADSIEAGRSKFPGMTYEEGVQAALRWAIGQDDSNPMSE